MTRPAMRDDLLSRFRNLGIETTFYEHEAVFTVEQARCHRGTIPGAHCKNLFLKDKKGQLWLIVCLEEASIDLKSLHQKIGAARLSFGKPELLMASLGVEPGSVSPFCLINDKENLVKVILDKKMMDRELLNYHPLENTATTSIFAQDLLTFIKSCGHQPKILEIY